MAQHWISDAFTDMEVQRLTPEQQLEIVKDFLERELYEGMQRDFFEHVEGELGLRETDA